MARHVGSQNGVVAYDTAGGAFTRWSCNDWGCTGCHNSGSGPESDAAEHASTCTDRPK
jgi:YD repeat-containing protein